VLARPPQDLQAKAIGVEHEEGPVARDIAVLLRWEMDPGTELDASLIGLLELFAGVNANREMLERDVV
jgi:hypothetical protein